jgi:16S rRNA (guanine966-N2)-methyltransferase
VTRIIGGAAGSLRLDVPKTGTRPTSDRVREAIFSALEVRDLVDGASVLDLYAGSGALGLEALSRGAAGVTLVDRATGAVMRANASRVGRSMGAPTEVTVIAQAVHGFLLGARGPYDLVFIDPPYELPADELERELAALGELLAPDAVVIVERSSRDPEPAWPAPLVLDRRKDYGDTALYWLAVAPQPAAPFQSS